MTTSLISVPTSEQSPKWAPWIALATLRATGGAVDTAASLADVREALVGIVGEAPVGVNTIASGAFYARKDGWMSSPKRGQHAVTASGMAALATLGFPVGGESVPAPAPVEEVPVAVEESPAVEEIAKVVEAEIIAFPTPAVVEAPVAVEPTPAPNVGVNSPGVAWTPPVVTDDPYAGVDDYIVGLAAAATPCFGGYSARAKTTCGVCPLAARCASSALTRVAEIAATIVREEAEAIRLAAEAEARRIREEAEAKARAEEAERVRVAVEAAEKARAEAEALLKDENSRKAKARAKAAQAVDDILGNPNPTTTSTGTGSTGSLADILANMASAIPTPGPTGVGIAVAFDAVCAHCRGSIPRDSSAVHIDGKGLFHISCANNA